MQKQELLGLLEPKCHQDRMRFMVQYGKNPNAMVLSELEAGIVYERHLALTTCFSSRNAAQVQRGLQDASKIIRALAISLAPVVLTDSQLLESLQIMPSALRLVLLHRLQRRKKAFAVSDALLKHFIATGNTRDATAILGFASLETIKANLALLEMASITELARLARNQAVLIADWLEKQASEVEINPRLIWQVKAVLPQIADFSGIRVQQLLRVMQISTPLGQFALQALVEQHPKIMAVLLLETEESTNLDFSAVAHRLDLSQVLALQAQQPQTLRQLAYHFKRFSPEARVVIFQTMKSEWTDSDGLIDFETLQLLPREQRQTQAKYHFGHPKLQAQPLQRLPYASLLHWDEAKVILETAIKHPKPEYRMVAIANLLYTARYDHFYDQLLEFVGFRKNEQDPIRQTILTAIAQLPPSRWKASHLERLSQILQDTLNAADLSSQTALAAEKLVVRLLPIFPDWAAKWITTLVKERGQINLYNIGHFINEEQAKIIAIALLPVLKAWETRERESQIIHLMTQFGQRLKVLPDFLELARRLVFTATSKWISQSALDLIAKYYIPLFKELIPKILVTDKSWATIPAVYQYLHSYRQDLITPFLGRNKYGGRFSTGNTRFVLPVHQDFYRWNPAQQTTFVQTLSEVTKDQDRDIPAIQFVLVQLANIPNASSKTIIDLADVHNQRLAIRDAAIRALGRLDEARGLEILLKSLEDNRARISIYALRRLVLSMPPINAIDLLRRTPLERVTVGKEVMRLIGEIHTELAHRQLLEFSQQTLHRDVRVALLRALWDYLEQPETWTILEAAAQNQDAAIADAVIRIPAERLSAAAQLKLVNVLSILLTHPDSDVRLETLQRCRWLPVTDTTKKLAQPLLSAIVSSVPNQTRIAVEAFLTIYTSLDTDLIKTTFETLLLNRRVLQEAVEAFLDPLFSRSLKPKRIISNAQAILAAFESDPLTLHLQTKIAMLCLPSQDAADFMTTLANQQQLHSDIYLTALEVLTANSSGIERLKSRLSTLEQTWQTHPNELLRRLALQALIVSASNQHGSQTAWTDTQLEVLEKYRSDPSNIVAAAAHFTFPVTELEE